MTLHPGRIVDEDDFQARVAKLAVRRYRLLHYHTHDSRRSDRGFLDSVFVGRRVLFRELKMTRASKVRPDQRVWLARLTAAGADAKIWYADDYHSGLVDEELAALEIRDGDGAPSATRLAPISVRLAKRLYLAGAGTNPGKAALLWEAGVASVGHGRWIGQAEQMLALVAEELPAGHAECEGWLAEHHLSDLTADMVLAAMSAIRHDLTAPAGNAPAR